MFQSLWLGFNYASEKEWNKYSLFNFIKLFLKHLRMTIS